eukprot:8793401-Alexandrium_andersonii.AAC.1
MEGSRAPTAALSTGGWFSAAVCAGSSRPTYSASREWNGVDHDDGATCIDHVLLNRAALHLFSGVEYIRNLDVPGHTALQVSFGIQGFRTRALHWTRPGPFPVWDASPVDEDEDEAIARVSWRASRASSSE